MGYENTSGLNVRTFYGPMSQTEGTEGSIRTEGSIQELALVVTGAHVVGAGAAFDPTRAYLPAGAKVKEVLVNVQEVFSVSAGASNEINIGTQGSEATNGVPIPEASLEATGIYVITSFDGTWANQLAANTQIGLADSGGGTWTTAGKARVVIRYIQLD
jgi:hypothetical protein